MTSLAAAQELKDIVRLCLCKDPADRPSCSLLLRHKFWKARQHLCNISSTTLASCAQLVLLVVPLRLLRLLAERVLPGLAATGISLVECACKAVSGGS